jgi:hypothetical protein
LAVVEVAFLSALVVMVQIPYLAQLPLLVVVVVAHNPRAEIQMDKMGVLAVAALVALAAPK